MSHNVHSIISKRLCCMNDVLPYNCNWWFEFRFKYLKLGSPSKASELTCWMSFELKSNATVLESIFFIFALVTSPSPIIVHKDLTLFSGTGICGVKVSVRAASMAYVSQNTSWPIASLVDNEILKTLNTRWFEYSVVHKLKLLFHLHSQDNK